MTQVTFDVCGASVTLPLQGALYVAHGLGEGVPDRNIEILSVLGADRLGTIYKGSKKHLDALIEEWDRLQAGHDIFSNVEPTNEMVAFRPKIDAAIDQKNKDWLPIQQIADNARAAVEAAGYDGAPS